MEFFHLPLLSETDVAGFARFVLAMEITNIPACSIDQTVHASVEENKTLQGFSEITDGVMVAIWVGDTSYRLREFRLQIRFVAMLQGVNAVPPDT